MVGQRAKIYGSYGTIEEAIRHENGLRSGTYKIAFRLKRRAGRRFIEEVQNYDFVHPDDIHLVKARRNPMSSPIHIPEKILSWRERLHKGSIMKPHTFTTIKRKAASKYKKRGVGKKVAGAAYYISLLRKYLDSHPGDPTATATLKRLLGRRGKFRTKHNPSLKWYIGISKQPFGKRVIFSHSGPVTRKAFGAKYFYSYGPFNSKEEASKYRPGQGMVW